MNMTSNNRRLYFSIYKNGSLYATMSTVEGIIKVGKDPKSTIMLDDEKCSRVHAVIEVSGADVMLIDMGNESGTFVNGTCIGQSGLKPGDFFVIGDTKVVFEKDSAPLRDGEHVATVRSATVFVGKSYGVSGRTYASRAQAVFACGGDPDRMLAHVVEVDGRKFLLGEEIDTSEPSKEALRDSARAKLTDDERAALGL